MGKSWKCPNGCDIEHVLVCGGNLEENEPNVYFQMTLGDDYTNRFADGTTGVKQHHYDHADGGCGTEPVCPKCCVEAVQ